MKKFLITENERKQILGLYEKASSDVIVTDWLSPDERYVIFLDELYDLKLKKKIGDIWENFDNFKFFLQYSFNVSDLPKQLKESLNNEINTLLLTESTKDLRNVKSEFKELLSEGLLSSFKNWAVKTGKSSWEGFKEFGKTVYKGTGDLFDKVSKGEWKQVFSLIGKGVLYVARKLRSAMYHPVGLILDAILVATQIGKTVQWIPWAIIVALDVYELVSGDTEENLPMWQQLLFLGIDILGLVFAGAMAKAARTTVKATVGGIKTTEQLGAAAAKNPGLKKILVNIQNSVGKSPAKLSEAATYLSTKFPKGASFITGILSKIGKFIKGITDFISKALHTIAPGSSKFAKGTRAAIGTTALVGGIGTYGEYKQEKEEEKLLSNINFDDIEFT